MRHKICYSQAPDAQAALDEIFAQLGGERPKLLIFASDTQNFGLYSEKLRARFPAAEILGSTSFMVFSSMGYSHTALAVAAMLDGVECCGGVLLDIARYPMKHAGNIRDCLARMSGCENCVCIEATTSGDRSEELVLDTLKEVLEPRGIPVCGTSAGSANAESTLVSLNGAVYSEACAFLLIRNTGGRVKIYEENLFRPTQHCFTATDVDCEERAVYEFDGKPAALVLANALGVSVDDLPGLASAHPLGRVVSGHTYITAPAAILPCGAITFFARVYSHTKLKLLEPDDMRAVLERTIARIKSEMPESSLMLVINCISRTQLFEQESWFADFSDALSTRLGDYIGVSGYGEHMNYELLNQTMVIAVFE